jgi:hypothetical protein
MKKHNFNAGPSILADEVIENAAKAILDFNGSGLSLLSISHRTKDFDDVMAEADVLFRELLHIPDNYKIIYLGGGASTYFYEIPANFLGRKAGYVNTGVWAKKAIKEAKRYGEVELLASSEDRNFTYIPKGFAIPADLDYVHITSNNTIYGTEYHEDLASPVPLIADMSSDILSRPVDVTKYAMIYGGAQKNLAPAGVAFAMACYIEMGKLPFDLAEAEQEIQEGPLAAYSGPSLAMLKLGVSVKQLVVASLLVAIFLPFGGAVDASPVAVLAGAAAYVAKVLVVMLAASVIENAVMRVRYKLLGRYTWFVTGIALLSLVFLVIGI